MNGYISIPTAIKSGKAVIKVRDTINNCRENFETNSGNLSEVALEVEKLIISAPANSVSETWRIMRTGLAVLACQGKCLFVAHGGQGNLAEEQARLQILFRELKEQLKLLGSTFNASISSKHDDLVNCQECEASLVADVLLTLPLPLIYWEKNKDRDFDVESDKPSKKEAPPVVRLIASLDDVPIATPQLIGPGKLYTLTFQIRGIGWPEHAESLQLKLLSTFPPEEYSISPFQINRPELTARGEYQEEISGQIKFKSAQSTILDDIVFRLRAAFCLANDGFQDVPIIGYHEIRLRVVSQDRYPRMGSSQRMDRHIEELVVKLLSDCPHVADEMDDLLPMLQALNRLLTTYAQHAIYKGVSKLLEKEFHATVLRDLAIQLGSDVQNHPNQAGGIGDIRYRGVNVELKVEEDNGDRKWLSQKFTLQATQYEGVEARQVSILLVLDLTAKDSPPGDLRNDVLLVDVPTHGGPDDDKNYPSKAFVFVINGNVKSPSEYSR